VQDESEGQVVNGARRKPPIVVAVEGSWKVITDAGLGTRIAENTEASAACPCTGVEEVDGIPGGR